MLWRAYTVLFAAALVVGGSPSRALADPDVSIWPTDLAVDTHLADQAYGKLNRPGMSLLPDGSGGTIVVWEDDYFGLLAAQRVAANGSLLWGPAGVYVAPADGLQWSPVAVSDGAGGVIVAWVDGRNGSCGYSFFAECDVYAQRLDASGVAVWADGGVPIAVVDHNQGTQSIAIATDGAGGAIVAWSDYRLFQQAAYAQRVNAQGQPLWAANGLLVSSAFAEALRLASDGAHGAILAWTGTRPSGGQALYIQRIDSAGQRQWGTSGIELEVNVGRAAITEDGSGGAVIGYTKLFDGKLLAHAQRVDASGSSLWPLGRLLADSAKSLPDAPVLVGDGEGGAIAVWQQGVRNNSLNADVYAQRIAADGNILWGVTGLPVSNRVSDEMTPAISADGEGGAVVAWNDCRNHPQLGCQVAQMDLYAQRLTSEGALAWGPDGIALSTAPGNQGLSYGAAEGPTSLMVLADSAGGAYVAWPDGRAGVCQFATLESNCDLYVQRVPEPASASSLAAGIALLLALHRRRRAQ
jgi:hypothetical protein